MRLLTFNIDSKLIQIVKEQKLYIVDVSETIEDAIYHSFARYYNLILIKSDDHYSCKKILENINCRITAVIIIANNPSKSFQLSLLKKGGLEVLSQPVCVHKLLTKMEVVHRENFKKKISYKNKYLLDINNEKLTSKESEKKVQLRGKTFSMLEYMLKNRHRSSISKNELLQCCWEEPEWVSENIIEVNINLIRNALKKSFNDNFIETIRHRGYKII